MTYQQAPDLQRVSWLERWAQKHKRGLEQFYIWAFLIGFASLCALTLSTAAADLDKALQAPRTSLTLQKPSFPTPATNTSPRAPGKATQSASGLSEDQEAVKHEIEFVAMDEGYSAPRFLSRLAYCESSLNPTAKSKSSSARGLFQILKTHDVSDECALSVDCSTRWTIKQLKAGHSSWWECADIIT